MLKMRASGRELTRVLGVWAVLGASAVLPAARGVSILPGDDIWATPCGGGTYVDFSSTPIPAGFFGPGSLPFSGLVVLGGSAFPAGPLVPAAPADVDTVVRRTATATPVCGGPAVMVPIEIVSLSLVSCSPITVSFGVGGPQMWNVSVCLDGSPQPTGSMTIEQDCLEGGSYSSTLPVDVNLVFTRVAPPGGPLSLSQSVTMVANGQWSAGVQPTLGPTLSRLAPGATFFRNYCGAGMVTPTINGPITDFFTGVDIPGCTDCVSPHQVRKRELTAEEAMLAAHGVLPSNQERQSGGSGGFVGTQHCCLPDGTCEDLPASQCGLDGGTPTAGANCASAVCGPPIPATSEWGLIILALSMTVAMVLIVRNRYPGTVVT